jgi:hypothetical protein
MDAQIAAVNAAYEAAVAPYRTAWMATLGRTDEAAMAARDAYEAASQAASQATDEAIARIRAAHGVS